MVAEVVAGRRPSRAGGRPDRARRGSIPHVLPRAPQVGHDTEAAAWVLPGRVVVRQHRAISPAPLAADREVLVRLDRDPVVPRARGSIRRIEIDHDEPSAVGEGLVQALPAT